MIGPDSHWVERLSKQREASGSHVIETGVLLAECKADLKEAKGYGQWIPTVRAAGYGERNAQRYMRVANHPFLSDATHMSFLPEELTKLYGLSAYEPRILEAARAAHRLFPQMTIKDIESLAMPDVIPHAFEKKRVVKLGDLGDIFHEDELATIIWDDCRDAVPRIPDESVSLALFDLPYSGDFDYLWPAMAEQMARVLIPGGSVVALCGHRQLPYVLNAMGEHLRYWWCCGMGHANSLNPALRGIEVAINWKPALWYVKDFRRGGHHPFPADFVTPAERDKRFHPWGQPVEWFGHWIEHLTEPGEIVLDPTMGAGSALIAASQLGRRSLGVDISRHHCNTAVGRLRELPEAS
jgi:hypothetical protein